MVMVLAYVPPECDLMDLAVAHLQYFHSQLSATCLGLCPAMLPQDKPDSFCSEQSNGPWLDSGWPECIVAADVLCVCSRSPESLGTTTQFPQSPRLCDGNPVPQITVITELRLPTKPSDLCLGLCPAMLLEHRPDNLCSDHTATAQLVEHLTVESSSSNQMVPGSIPGGRNA